MYGKKIELLGSLLFNAPALAVGSNLDAPKWQNKV